MNRDRVLKFLPKIAEARVESRAAEAAHDKTHTPSALRRCDRASDKISELTLAMANTPAVGVAGALAKLSMAADAYRRQIKMGWPSTWSKGRSSAQKSFCVVARRPKKPRAYWPKRPRSRDLSVAATKLGSMIRTSSSTALSAIS